MKRRIMALVLALAMALPLSGCGLLERGYGSVEPHSSSYYESGAANVLRAENNQDLVNDLLLLIGDYAAEGTIWLYPGEESLEAEQAIEDACQEVQRETPMGAYAVEYMTYTVSDDNRAYSEIKLTIGYRRTEAELKNVVHATSVSALHTLLTASYKKGQPNLNVMFQYNMPLRALAKMTSGAISMGMVDGIVLEAKGFWIIGLLKVIAEAVKNVILNAQMESRLRNS